MKTIIKNVFLFIITGLLINSSSCIYNEDNKELKREQKQPITKKQNIDKSNEFYYYSASNNPKHDHQIKGKDENGEDVNGVINLENEIGIGVVKGKDNNEIEIISEHINSNGIIATDINGMQYKLKVD